MNKPFFRANIPLGSTFAVQVSGTGDADAQAFTSTGTMETPGGQPVQWTDAQLRSGNASVLLDKTGSYAGRIDLAFARNSTARLRMQVTKPDGSKFVYDQSLTQGAGLDRTFILLATQDA